MFIFLVCIFSSSSDVVHYMMFWRVPNKMEQRKELFGFYVFIYMDGDNPVKLREELTEFYSGLGVADSKMTQPWRQRTADTWKNNNNQETKQKTHTSWW